LVTKELKLEQPKPRNKEIHMEASTKSDKEQIERWCKADIDPAHHNIKPDFFYTGETFLTFKITDDIGTVLFVRSECYSEEPIAVLHLQFPPESEVSKRRLIHAILVVFPTFMGELKENFSAVNFTSTSQKLIGFFRKLGFKSVLGTDDFIFRLPVVTIQIFENVFGSGRKTLSHSGVLCASAQKL
jgi:hypothetical protein